jgi:hypothetical protein
VILGIFLLVKVRTLYGFVDSEKYKRSCQIICHIKKEKCFRTISKNFLSCYQNLRGRIGDICELKRVYHVYRDYFARNNKAFDLEQR